MFAVEAVKLADVGLEDLEQSNTSSSRQGTDMNPAGKESVVTGRVAVALSGFCDRPWDKAGRWGRILMCC